MIRVASFFGFDSLQPRTHTDPFVDKPMNDKSNYSSNW